MGKKPGSGKRCGLKIVLWKLSSLTCSRSATNMIGLCMMFCSQETLISPLEGILGVREELTELIDGVIFISWADSVFWCLEKIGIFSTKLLYKEMFFPGMHNIWMQGVWKAKLPLKIKIFLWQVCNNKVQSAEQLRKRNWPGDLDCKMLGDRKQLIILSLDARWRSLFGMSVEMCLAGLAHLSVCAIGKNTL